MRILESLYGIPQSIELLGTVISYLADARSVIDKLAVSEYLYEDLLRRIVCQRLRLPRLNGIEDLIRLAVGNGLTLYEKNICSIYVTDFLRKRKKKPTLTDIEETLLLCKGNKCKAARKLGISRGSLCYQLQKGRVKIAS